MRASMNTTTIMRTNTRLDFFLNHRDTKLNLEPQRHEGTKILMVDLVPTLSVGMQTGLTYETALEPKPKALPRTTWEREKGRFALVPTLCVGTQTDLT